MEGKRVEEKDKNKKRSVFSIILTLIFISMMIYSGWKIYNWMVENSQSHEIIARVSNAITINENVENIDRYSVDLDALKETNSDTVGWIKVPGTDIEYPVVKTSNNDYYLRYSFDKSYNTAGWIFMDYNNKLDGNDDHIILYGHNRKDGSMFGSLKRILTKEWQDNKENQKLIFINELGKFEYEVFSVYRVENEDYYITTNFVKRDDFQKFIDVLKSRSEKFFDVEVTNINHILTLSTCDDNNDYRVVLHAKLIEK